MDAPRASIIVPTYNRLATLPRAVESALAQTERNIEILIADDASQDGTQTYLAGLNDPRIRVLRAERNEGPGAARNRGLHAARAPIVAFLDSDDSFRPQRVTAALAAFDRDPDIVCTLSSTVKQDTTRGRSQTVEFPALKLAPRAFEWALVASLISVEGTGITARRQAAIAAGGFAVKLRRSEDSEFLIRLSRLGAAQMLPEILWDKYWSPDGLSNDQDNAGPNLLAFARERPELTREYRRIGSYMATKVLVADLKDRRYDLFTRDVAGFRAVGLLHGTPLALWRNHRMVRRYRRANKNHAALSKLIGPPVHWH